MSRIVVKKGGQNGPRKPSKHVRNETSHRRPASHADRAQPAPYVPCMYRQVASPLQIVVHFLPCLAGHSATTPQNVSVSSLATVPNVSVSGLARFRTTALAPKLTSLAPSLLSRGILIRVPRCHRPRSGRSPRGHTERCAQVPVLQLRAAAGIMAEVRSGQRPIAAF